MRIRPIAISAAFAVGLATLPLSTAEAQSNPPQYYPPCSPFPLAWPFCVAGAVLGIAAAIVTVPIRLLTGAPPFGYHGPPFSHPHPFTHRRRSITRRDLIPNPAG
jgi:hypothetical protein